MAVTTTSIQQLAINTIRTLSMDAVQQANSGHPGTPMALAPVAYLLWNDRLRFDPRHPHWPARDRFVLSCGHASMLLYSMLHLAGVKRVGSDGQVQEELSISLADIEAFRQLNSPCAGHPEFGHAAGIETTTGPLGQGIGNSVGMAAAARWLASRYDRPGYGLFGYDVYALCSDGDLMEGVGCEAASLAGHLKLANLCWIYDDNHITIEGDTELAFSEDVGSRFESLGWRAVQVDDANDLDALQAALQSFDETDDRPTIIVMRSVIGYGSPNKANTHGAHGSPLGEDEIRLTKEFYGWPADERFRVPREVTDHFEAGIGARGSELHAEWSKQLDAYTVAHPAAAAELRTIWGGGLPEGWDADIPSFEPDPKGMASRSSSGKVLNAIAERVPWLLGGSADLAPSNNTLLTAPTAGHFGSEDYRGRNFHFGIREHAMASFCNGLALSGLRPYCGTFFVFTDYLRPALRLSSLMQQPVLYILTHDSIGLGEDGPTHQPIEHLAACRAIPGLQVIRPADANEVAESYRCLLAIGDRPAALILSRQNLPTLPGGSAAGVSKGAYVLADAAAGDPTVLLMGTGSEVAVCLEAYHALQAAGIATRVVSMPCWEWFDAQPASYREAVLPSTARVRVGVEAGIRQGWDRYLGTDGLFVGMDTFGASAPYQELYEQFGITAERIAALVQSALE